MHTIFRSHELASNQDMLSFFSSKIRSFKFEYVPKIYNIIVVFPLMETIVIVFSIFVNHQTEKIVILGL